MGSVSYPLNDEELASLSRNYALGRIEITRRTPLKNGGTNLYMSDGAWNYLVVETAEGDWSWGFRTEVERR